MAAHGQRSLADCSPQGNKEAGVTEGTLCTHALPQWKQVEAGGSSQTEQLTWKRRQNPTDSLSSDTSLLRLPNTWMRNPDLLTVLAPC